MCISSNWVNDAQDSIAVKKFRDFPNSLIPSCYVTISTGGEQDFECGGSWWRGQGLHGEVGTMYHIVPCTVYCSAVSGVATAIIQ